MAKFDNSFARELPEFVVRAEGAKAGEPEIVAWNAELARDLGLEDLAGRDWIWAGAGAPDGVEPVAMAYAGHQFGGFSAQLGDGRAMLLGEVLDRGGRRFDVHLKGSGKTVFSRPGTDGKAVLGPVLREYLFGEAMWALGVPSTRALAATRTGEVVFRQGAKPGAVLARVAASHIRVGSFQYVAAKGDQLALRKLADYAIARHDEALLGREDRYLAFLLAVVERQAALVAKWMSLGFVHGVMNTDNVSIAGETIDYGPCAFMEAFDPATVFSSIDHGGRYAFGNQPMMAQWNLARFSEALLPLLAEDQDEAVALASRAVNEFAEIYLGYWRDLMGRKLGLGEFVEGDLQLLNTLLQVMKNGKADFTRSFRALGDDEAFLAEFADDGQAKIWLGEWRARVGTPDLEAMRAVNPIYIPRNHLVDEALRRAEDEADYSRFFALLEMVRRPFEAEAGKEEYAQKAPKEFGAFVTFCGT